MKHYLVIAIRNPHFDPAVVEPHMNYIGGLRTGGRLELAGGFSDQSGGAYVLRAESLEEATTIVHADPAHISGGWTMTIHEWAMR